MTSAQDKPLAGKRIVITRAPEQSREIVRELTEAGAEALLIPCVAFSPAEDSEPLDQALRSLTEFDWIIFTSQNAVQACAERARAAGVSLGPIFPFANPPVTQDSGEPRAPRVAAVGPATANAASRAGLRVDFVAKEYRGAALAAELGESVAGKRILLPRSNCAGRGLPIALRELGANVTEVVAYRTGLAQPVDRGVLDAVRAGKADVIAFFSPSALQNFIDELGAEPIRSGQSIAVAAIGPVTANAIQQAGLRVDILAREATPTALVRAICDFFSHPLQCGASQK